MAWNSLKNSVNANITANGNQEITGPVLNTTLVGIINALGENATFKGIAYLTTDPGIPDGPVFYIAQTKGTYSNFSGFSINNNYVCIFYWNSVSWAKFETVIPIVQSVICVNNTEDITYTLDTAVTKVPPYNRALGVTLIYKTESGYEIKRFIYKV